MGVILVSAFNKLTTPKDVTYQVTPEDDVGGLKATLFRKEGSAFEQIKKWNSTQLENGVTFPIDEQADRFDLVLTAKVTKNSFVTAETTFDPKPPADSIKKVVMKSDEGLIERLWLFMPLHKVK